GRSGVRTSRFTGVPQALGRRTGGAGAGMSEPTRFQQATADYAVSRLWRERAPAYRFLVADEVGLGKTIVAREIIRQTLKRFPEGPVDIIYVCSSQAIASQNLDKLVIDAGG